MLSMQDLSMWEKPLKDSPQIVKRVIKSLKKEHLETHYEGEGWFPAGGYESEQAAFRYSGGNLFEYYYDKPRENFAGTVYKTHHGFVLATEKAAYEVKDVYGGQGINQVVRKLTHKQYLEAMWVSEVWCYAKHITLDSLFRPAYSEPRLFLGQEFKDSQNGALPHRLITKKARHGPDRVIRVYGYGKDVERMPNHWGFIYKIGWRYVAVKKDTTDIYDFSLHGEECFLGEKLKISFQDWLNKHPVVTEAVFKCV